MFINIHPNAYWERCEMAERIQLLCHDSGNLHILWTTWIPYILVGKTLITW